MLYKSGLQLHLLTKDNNCLLSVNVIVNRSVNFSLPDCLEDKYLLVLILTSPDLHLQKNIRSRYSNQ